MQRPTRMIGVRVQPGEEQPLEFIDDVRITNIAFGEEVKGTGRTVVRVHHRRIPDFEDLEQDFDLDDLEDDESDEDDEDEDDDDEEDEDEEEEDAEVDAEVLLTKKGKKGAKVNGIAVADVEADVDDEDEDDEELDLDEGDESLLEEEEEHTYIICSLYPGKIEQVSVNLAFTVGDDVRFSVSGDNAVEILGNVMKPGLLDTYDEEPDEDELLSDYEYDSELDESIDSEDAMYAEIEGEDSDEEDSDDDELRIEEVEVEEDSDEDDEEEEEVVVKAKPVAASKKRSAAEADIADEDVSMTAPVTDVELVSAAKAAGLDPANLSKNQRKKLNKRLRGEADESADVEPASVKSVATAVVDGAAKVATAAKDAVTKNGKAAAKTTKLPSGVVIEDRKVGSGPAAKNGNRLGMRYVGRLQSNGKQFDANTKGKPFSFRLGKGEVIGGWDEGLKGMQVGGERRLVIPPKQGYGARGAPPDIPGNSTLVFDVKLVEIK